MVSNAMVSDGASFLVCQGRALNSVVIVREMLLDAGVGPTID
jgi:hypothetical protein